MILVTCAGGKTGRAMISAFANAGEKVRAMQRSMGTDEELTALGASEIVHADLGEAGAVADAAIGCRAIYYICPNMTQNERCYGENVIAAARSAGVERLLFHSVLHTQVQALQHHWNRLFVEEAIVESGVPFSILQVGSYYQNMLPGWSKMVETGIHAMAYNVDVPMSLVDLEDVSAAALAVLRDPGCANGIFEICGPVITLREKAEILSDVLGRSVEAQNCQPMRRSITRRAWASAPTGRNACAECLRITMNAGWSAARVLGWLLARPPTDFETFARRTAAAQK